MVYYKDLNNALHAIESIDFESILPVGCVEITQQEAEDLLAPTVAAQLEIDRSVLKENRDSALVGLDHDFGDGRVMQVRPQDAGNIQIAIGIGTDQEWVMDDNTVATVTSAELQAAFDAGVQKAMVVWSDYMTAIKAL